ncbi:MAG: alpha/beta fold hydrolase [Gammaproteobacteria bacterium]|nr:MAG: alpha/beta fold hydrolase [Gammaproteobacteria bacterium]
MNKIKYVLVLLMFIFSSLAKAAALNRAIPYRDLGQGTPLVLIHAFPTDQELWVPQIAELKQHFRILTLDLWGFGRHITSGTEGQAVTMAEYAEEVKRLLDTLHIQKAIIGGESMGGYIALAFFKKYPDRVEGLILSDTQSIADTPEVKAKREIAAANILENGPASFIQTFMSKALSPQASKQTQQYLQTMIEAQKPTSMASALRGMALREDTSALLAKTTLPILIITGKEDALISPQQSQNMHALAKNSKLIIIPQAGHLSNLEQPIRWNQAVIAMFDKGNV